MSERIARVGGGPAAFAAFERRVLNRTRRDWAAWYREVAMRRGVYI